MVPGHEIAGVVSEVGAAVTRHKVGDRVGVGCMVDSCGECAQCKDGHENFCETKTVWTYNDAYPDGEPTYGGYSRQVVVSERFALRIPEGLGLDEAAPLLCAGITTYNPLKRWGAGPGTAVAVVGMGGLGHVAVKIAVAMGATVTVLSHTLSKEEDGRSFGAADYRATSDPATFKELRRSFDLIVSTVSADLPVDRYLSLLKPFGVFVDVGLPERAQQVSFGALCSGDKVLAGSNIGGVPLTQEMLEFCAGTGSGRTSRRSRPTRSTRHTTGSSRATCATGSSSTPRRSPRRTEPDLRGPSRTPLGAAARTGRGDPGRGCPRPTCSFVDSPPCSRTAQRARSVRSSRGPGSPRPRPRGATAARTGARRPRRAAAPRPSSR